MCFNFMQYLGMAIFADLVQEVWQITLQEIQ